MSLSTRFSYFFFTKDFRYFRLGLLHWPPAIEFDFTHVGKKVIGVKGLPFSSYKDCKVTMSGTMPQPTCGDYTEQGEHSILYNIIFWSILSYIFWIVNNLLKLKKKLPNQKQ